MDPNMAMPTVVPSDIFLLSYSEKRYFMLCNVCCRGRRQDAQLLLELTQQEG